jgi:glutaredoxin-like YruB-family protein
MITIYTTPQCVYCKKAKEFFISKGLAYIEKDVEEDELAREEMFAKTQKLSVPIIVINERTVVGYNEAAILSALKAGTIENLQAFTDPAEENLCDSCQ